MSAAPPIRLNVESALYEAHKAEWLKSHSEEFVVIKESQILGFFSNFHTAYSAGVEKFGMGVDFLVKRVVPQEPVFLVF